jgi:hypothetical protein
MLWLGAFLTAPADADDGVPERRAGEEHSAVERTANRPMDWSETQAEAAIAGVAGVRETRWQQPRPPGGPSDRIQVHRYRGDSPPVAALLYLPGTHMNGELHIRDEDHNLWIFLARRGIDVYTLDYRTHFVSPDADTELSFMADWTLGTFAADVASAAALVQRGSRDLPLFVAGFSRGVTFAYTLAAGPKAPALAGLIALDGGLKEPSAGNSQEPYDAAAVRKQIIAAKRYAIDVGGRTGWDVRGKLMQTASERPDGPPIADDAFASVGAEVARKLYDSWGPGALAHPIGVPGSTSDTGVSRVDVLARLLLGYDRYYPAIQGPEGRAIAAQADAPHTPLDDRWGELLLPILYFGATQMGDESLVGGRYSAEASGSTDVMVRILEGYGHLDVLVSEKSRAEVFEPTLTWTRERAPGAPDRD